jgi:hypothetical protein
VKVRISVVAEQHVRLGLIVLRSAVIGISAHEEIDMLVIREVTIVRTVQIQIPVALNIQEAGPRSHHVSGRDTGRWRDLRKGAIAVILV